MAVPKPPEAVIQDLVAATAGAQGYTVSTAGSGTLILTRRYWPTWVIVVAVLGTLLFLVGLLALLIRTTETLTVSIKPAQNGSEVSVNGVGSSEIIGRLESALAGSGTADAMEPSSSDQVTGSAVIQESKVCPECAETIKAGANVCRYCGHRFAETVS